MAGHMGDARVTAQNLEVVATDLEHDVILVRGAVPGSKGGYVLVSDAIKRQLPEGVPFPAAVRAAASADAAPATDDSAAADNGAETSEE